MVVNGGECWWMVVNVGGWWWMVVNGSNELWRLLVDGRTLRNQCCGLGVGRFNGFYGSLPRSSWRDYEFNEKNLNYLEIHKDKHTYT